MLTNRMRNSIDGWFPKSNSLKTRGKHLHRLSPSLAKPRKISIFSENCFLLKPIFLGSPPKMKQHFFFTQKLYLFFSFQRGSGTLPKFVWSQKITFPKNKQISTKKVFLKQFFIPFLCQIIGVSSHLTTFAVSSLRAERVNKADGLTCRWCLQLPTFFMSCRHSITIFFVHPFFFKDFFSIFFLRIFFPLFFSKIV